MRRATARVFAPGLTPQTLEDLIFAVPAAARAELLWAPPALSAILRPLQHEVPSDTDLRPITQAFWELAARLFAVVAPLDGALQMAAEASRDAWHDSASEDARRLGGLAGAAARWTFAAQAALSGWLHSLLEQHSLDLAGLELGEGPPLTDRIDDDSPLAAFLAGYVLALSLRDALERGLVGPPLERLALTAFRRIHLGLTDPDFARLPDPFAHETDEEQDARMLEYIQFGAQARTPLEREVALQLRVAHLRFGGPEGRVVGQCARWVHQIYSDALRRMA